MHTIGLHFDSPFIKACRLRKNRSGIEIVSLHSALLQNPDDVKLLYIQNQKSQSSSALPAKHILIRSLELQKMSGRHAEEVIAFQAEATSHLATDKALTICQLKGRKHPQLITADKEGLKQHLEELSKLSIDPDNVTIVPSALCHFARWKFPSLQNAFLVDIGTEETTCVWMEEGVLKKAHSIPIGAANLIAALFEDRKKVLLRKEIDSAAKQIDLLLLKSGLNPHLTSLLEELRQGISKARYSFAGDEKQAAIMTGKVDTFIHLQEFLLGKPEHILTQEEQSFAIAIGAAVEQTSLAPVNLRQKEFFPEKNWRKMGLYASSLLTLSFLLGFSLMGFGFYASHLKKSEMAEKFQGTQGSLEERIDHWITSIESNNKEYPYILQTPRVSDTLSWISNHPLLEQMKQEGDPINVREVHYELVKFPKVSALKEPYLAKVELEFQFKNSMNARKFHEALRSDVNFIDVQKEIGWEALSEGYRASFFLKNRGAHVL